MGISEHTAALLRRQFLQVALQESQVALDRGERGAQFVGGIDHLPHLVMSPRPGDALAETAKARPACRGGSDGARGGDHARQGPQHTGGQNPTPDERSCQRGQPGKQEQAQPGFLTGSS